MIVAMIDDRSPSPFANPLYQCMFPALAGALFLASAQAEDAIGFNRQIRPLLSACFSCHGPDEKHREASMRLDVRDGALAEHDGVRAIVPGHPEDSELLERVSSHDPDEMMPPPKSKKPPLAPEDIATLRKWIAQGAPYQNHWAFIPLADEPPPPVRNSAWPLNPIDQFILARLESEGLTPSPEADRRTLIRRVSLDLIGLLPAPEETEAFVADLAPNAYERLVDRLLANPHYGERWGRHWLDQARYADSNGYTIDSEREMWPYRDWVIKALNDDLPFDRFTIEQLAGDLLPHPTKSQLIATAFHRNTMINEEGGAKPEQFRVESVIDRVNTTGSVWLGLTVGCAQCHSHKFDPIPHREYYQMLAFFNEGEDVNNKGATVKVAPGEIFGEAPPAETQARSKADPSAAAQAEWEKRELARLAETPSAAVKWTPAHYLEYDTASGAGFQLLTDNSLLADGRGAFNDTYRIKTAANATTVAAVRLRVLADDSLPHHGPGMAANGNFVLTQFELTAGGQPAAVTRAFADHEQPGYPASAAIDGDPGTGWAINVGKGSTVKMNSDHEIVFILEKPLEPGAEPLEIKLRHDKNQNYLIGRFSLEFAATAPAAAGAQAEQFAAALQTPPEERTPEQAKLVREAYLSATPDKSEAKRPSDIAELMIMKETAEPRPTFIFLRGDFLRPDEKTGPLQPGVLTAVNTAFSQPQADFHNRLDLARWLVSPDNPLTPRVAMNRTWMHYFARGIVETDDDFGTQGTPPTHPELLDWLAREFIRQRWSMKAMHRLIVTSATYRQASKARPETMERDARNLLLSRQDRVRVDAEIVRDAALSASGLLSGAIGGPSVRPPQPEGVFSFTQATKKWTPDTGANRYRRALYTRFYRSAPHPLFTAFDAPNFQTVCTRRLRSDTPLQALTVANDAMFLEIAEGLAARALRETPGGDRSARLSRMFLLCLCREPSSKERQILEQYYDGQLASFADDALAQTLAAPGTSASGESPEALAALTASARAILNTDAFITRE